MRGGTLSWMLVIIWFLFLSTLPCLVWSWCSGGVEWGNGGGQGVVGGYRGEGEEILGGYVTPSLSLLSWRQ